MRRTILDRTEKEKVEKLLKELDILPPVSGQVTFNIDGHGKVVNAELGKIIFR